jgi:hypothetical protein
MNGRHPNGSREGDRGTIWRAARPLITPRDAAWFLDRFLTSSAILVRKWGPSWASQRYLFGREIGTWLLVLFWFGLPAAALVRETWMLVR